MTNSGGAGALEQQHRRELAGPSSAASIARAVLVGRRARAIGVDVGPVDGQRGQRPRRAFDAQRERSHAPELARQPLDLGRERARAPARAWPRARPRRTARESPGHSLPQRGQRRLAGRIDEQRADVVRGTRSRPSRHTGQSRSRSSGSRIFSTHTRSAPALAQPRQVAGGVGEPVGMVDPQAVDEPVAHEREHQLVRLLEHLRVLLADAGQVVDVEEAAVAAGRPGRCRRTARAAPGRPSTRFASSAAMWLGTMSSTMPMPGVARAAGQPLGTRPRRRARRTAGRGRSRRSRGSSPAAPAATGDRYRCEMPRSRRYGTSARAAAKPKLGGQLQPVGGAQLASARRAPLTRPACRITIERDIDRRPRCGRRSAALPGSASGSAVESSSAHCAPKRRRGSMNVAVLVVGVEQQQERVVLDRPRRGARGSAISRAVEEHPEHVLAVLPVAPGHLAPVGAEPPDVGQPRALDLLARAGSSRGGTPGARGAARSAAA